MRLSTSAVLLSGILALSACGSDPAAPTTPDAPAPTSPADDGDLYAWLVENEVPNDPLRVDLPQDLIDGSLVQDEQRHKVGVTHTLEEQVRLADQRPAFGAMRTTDSGFVWSGAIESDDAAALRFGLEDFFVPADAALYLYDELGEVAGPYTGFGPQGDAAFWTHTLRGDRVNFQLHYAGPTVDEALQTTAFAVSEVGHLDQRFLAARYGDSDADYRAFCSFNDTCVENAECSTLPSAVDVARDAVALMVYSSGPWQYICSGGLVADDAGSGTPHFITANHCISKGREANSLETYFDFTTPCGGSCALNQGYNTLGSTIESTSSTSDYTLLLLSGSLPSTAQFLARNATPVADADGTPLYRISHPGGAPQAYSEHTVDASAGTCSSWPRGDWIYSRDVYGATEGGSSGSPVVNAAGELVGQLSGGCGFNVNDVCDNVSNATVDGAYAAYASTVEPYLGGSTSCTDADGDGWCVSDGDCDDADATVNPGASEICDDGIDNNCDGTVDENCGGDGGTCELAQVGDSCSADADCCSNKCKGRPGAQTCK